MSVLSNLRDRARALFGRTESVGDHTDGVPRDRLDDIMFDNVRSQAPGLDRMMRKLAEEYGQTDDLCRDFYRALFLGEGKTRLLAEMRPSHRSNVQVEKQTFGTQNFAELGTLCEGDEYDAALALMSYEEPLTEVLEATREAREKAAEAQRERDEARKQAEEARKAQQEAEQAEQKAQQEQSNAERAEQQAQEAQQQAEQKQREAEAAQQQAEADPNSAEAQAAAAAAQQAAQAAAQQAAEAQASADGARGQATGATDWAQQAAQSLESIIAAAEQSLAQADQNAERSELLAAAATAELNDRLAQASREALADRDKERALFEAFGYGPGDLQRMDFAERAELAEMLKGSRLAEFTDLIGGFRLMESASRRRKTQHGHNEVHGIELGNDLGRMLASELVAMATEELEDDFWRRFATHQLMQVRMRGSEKVGRGAMVAVVDESGTMRKTDMAGGNSREALSKAMCLAMLDRARSQERDFVYIGFSADSQQHVVRFPKGRGSIHEVMRMTEHFYAGGTHFETPLEMARKVIEDDFTDHGLAKADVMFLTDGQAPISEQFVIKWNELREKAGFRCWGVAVSAESSTVSIDRVCDNVRSIGEYTAAPLTDAAEDMFAVL